MYSAIKTIKKKRIKKYSEKKLNGDQSRVAAAWGCENQLFEWAGDILWGC